MPHVHDHPAFLRLLRITPVLTPTEASWLNLIEGQFGVTQRFTLTDTDDPSYHARRHRIARSIRYRNRRAGVVVRRDFVPESGAPERTEDLPRKAELVGERFARLNWSPAGHAGAP